MEVFVIGPLSHLWAAGHRLVSYGLSFVGGAGWEDLIRADEPPTMQVLVPFAVAILLMPVVARWSGSLFRMTIILMALLVPVWVVLPAL